MTKEDLELENETAYWAGRLIGLKDAWVIAKEIAEYKSLSSDSEGGKWRERQKKDFCTNTDCYFYNTPEYGCKQPSDASMCAGRKKY